MSGKVEVYDNRGREPLVPSGPLVKGLVVEVSSYSDFIFITLDTGYTIHLPKSLVPKLVKAAEEQ